MDINFDYELDFGRFAFHGSPNGHYYLKGNNDKLEFCTLFGEPQRIAKDSPEEKRLRSVLRELMMAARRMARELDDVAQQLLPSEEVTEQT